MKRWNINLGVLGVAAVAFAVSLVTFAGAQNFTRLYNVVFDTQSPNIQYVGTATLEKFDGTDLYTLTDAGVFKCDLCTDGTTFKINSQNYTHTSGKKAGIQTKPNVTVGGSGVGMTAVEISPRFADGIAGAELIGMKIDPVLKGTTGDLTESVRALEMNLDFGVGSTRTISGDVVGLRIFYQAAPGMTVTGNEVPFLVADPDSRQWTHLMEIEVNNGTIADSSQTGTAATRAGFILVEVGGNDRYIRLWDAIN